MPDFCLSWGIHTVTTGTCLGEMTNFPSYPQLFSLFRHSTQAFVVIDIGVYGINGNLSGSFGCHDQMAASIVQFIVIQRPFYAKTGSKIFTAEGAADNAVATAQTGKGIFPPLKQIQPCR